MSLSERLRKCAELAGSGDKLAREAAIPRRSLEYYLSGKAEPKAGRLAAIVSARKISGHWLLTGEGPMLLADLNRPVESAPQMAVNADLLADALAAVDKIAAERKLALSHDKRAKLVALVYQYTMLDRAEAEANAYLSQLMELVSNN